VEIAPLGLAAARRFYLYRAPLRQRAMNSILPSGTVTFLFTDIESSTRLWQENPQAMSVAHARHDAIVREAIEANNGYIFQIVGDSYSAAFHNAIDGL